MRVIKCQDEHIINRIIINELAKVNEIYLKIRETEDVSFETFDKNFLNIDNTKFAGIIKLHCKNISKDSSKVFYTVKKQLDSLFG